MEMNIIDEAKAVNQIKTGCCGSDIWNVYAPEA